VAKNKQTIQKETEEYKIKREGDAEFFCPIGYTIDIISQKWTLYIIRELNNGSKYFNEILNSLNWGLTPKILSLRLKQLIQENIINKEIIEGSPPRVRYSLTKRGKEFIECFKNIEKWSKKWNVLKKVK
jgi:DNA-binding HxlR family transcriptional regulator